MLFDGPPSKLPIATLRPATPGQRRPLLGLRSWLAQRGAWCRPRAVPLLVAFASLFAMLGALEAMTAGPRGKQIALAVQSIDVSGGTNLDVRTAPLNPGQVTRPPIRFLLRPIAPGDHSTELTIRTLELR